MKPHLILLPGMDGSGRLFAPLEQALGRRARTSRVSYPPDHPLGYDELVDRVRAGLPDAPCVLVAESFSGPLAVRVAAEQGRGRIQALVLCATFLRSPLPVGVSWLRVLARAPLLRWRPEPLLRHLLLDRGADLALVSELRAAVDAVQPQVLAHRLRQVLRVDVRAAAARLDLPLLHLAAARDRLLGRRCARLLRALVPHGTHLELDGPHLLLQAQPEAAAVRVLEWLDALPAP